MPTPTSSEGGGNTTAEVVASGKVLPVAAPSGVTVDSTTYNNPITGSGKLTTLVFPADTGALAFAINGDTYPRFLFPSSALEGIYLGRGSTDLYSVGPNIYCDSNEQIVLWPQTALARVWCRASVKLDAARGGDDAPQMQQLSPKFLITSGALSTVALVSGTGAQVSTTRDAETVTPFTGDGTNNAATCLIQLSPDNVTYSTLATISIAAALNLTGVLTDTVNCRVPAGWYIKLTATHGALGTTTYY